MKKMLNLLMATMLLFSAIPLAFADNHEVSTNDSDEFEACLAVFEPVCGSDGRVHGNECEARRIGVEPVRKLSDAVTVGETCSLEEDDSTDSDNTDDDSSDSDGPVTHRPIPEKIRAVIKSPLVAAKIKEISDEREDIKRELGKKITDAKRNYLTARGKFFDLREKYLEKKDRFQELREKLHDVRQEFRNADEDRKAELREKLKDNAVETLIHQIDAILHHLDALEDKGVAPDNLEEVKLNFEQIKAELQDEPTQDQVIDAAKKIRRFWNSARANVQNKAAGFLNDKLSNLIERAESLYDNLSDRIANVENEDVKAKLERALNVLRNHLDRVINAHQELKEQWRQASEENDFEKRHEILKKANNLLRKAYHVMKEDFKLIKQIIRHLNTAETDLVEIDTTDADEAVEELEDALETEEA